MKAFLSFAVMCLLTISTFGGSQIKNFSAIVIPPQAKESEKLAAREIQRFIRQAAGVKLPITEKAKSPAIFVGSTSILKKYGIDTGKFTADEYVVKAVAEGVIVAGKDYPGGPVIGLRHPFNKSVVYHDGLKLCAFGSSGTIFASYAFLEECFGIRFYWPGKLGIVVPKTQGAKLNTIDLRRKPEFRYRNIYYLTFNRADRDNVLWYKQLGLGGDAPVQLNHSFRYLEPIAKANPEFYGMLNGKRHAGKGFTVSESQYCLSNKEFRKKVAEFICKYFDDNPQHKIYPLVPGDGCHRICECPDCQAQLRPELGADGEFSYHVWDFINEVGKMVYAKHPECSVGGLAYGRYFTKPKEVKLHPSISVMICRQRGFFVSPQIRDMVYNNILTWAKETDNIFFWDYYLTYWRPPWRDYPVIFPDTIQQDLQFMKKHRMGGEFLESTVRRSAGQKPQIILHGQQHLNIYITSKLYWNTDLDVSALLDEYYRLFYGPAEKEMRKFWETSRRCWNVNGKKNFISKTAKKPDTRATAIFSADDMAQMDKYLKQALKKVPANSDYAKRITIIANEFKSAMERHGMQLKFKPQTITIFDKSVKPKKYRFTQKDGRRSSYPTYAEIFYDRNNLYINLIAFEPDMKNIRTKAVKDHDGKVSGDDCFEIFVNGNADDRMLLSFFQIDLNANGVNCGWIHPPGSPSGNRNWRSPARVKAQKKANRWEAQIVIPLGDVALPIGKKGSAFAMNIFRMRIAGGPYEVSSLIPTFTFAHGEVDKFCRIEMK